MPGADHVPVQRRRCRRRGSGRAACRWRCHGRRRSTSPTSATTASTGCACSRAGERSVNLNAVDFGAAYLPQNQDPTLGTSTVPGASAYPTNMLRALARLQQHQRADDELLGRRTTAIQISLNRRFRDGLAFGANYTSACRSRATPGLGLQLACSTRPTARSRSAPIRRVREAEQEPRDCSATSSRPTRCGTSAERAGGAGQRRRGDPQRLAAVGVLTAGSRPPPLRPRPTPTRTTARTRT